MPSSYRVRFHNAACLLWCKDVCIARLVARLVREPATVREMCRNAQRWVCCRCVAGVLQVRLCARGRKHRLGEITLRCTLFASLILSSSEAPVPVRVGRDAGETTSSLGLVGETTPKALETREASSLPTLCGEW